MAPQVHHVDLSFVQVQQMQLFFKFFEHQPAFTPGDDHPVQSILRHPLRDLLHSRFQTGIGEHFAMRHTLQLLKGAIQMFQIDGRIDLVSALA